MADLAVTMRAAAPSKPVPAAEVGSARTGPPGHLVLPSGVAEAERRVPPREGGLRRERELTSRDSTRAG